MGNVHRGLLMIPVTGFFHVPGIWDMKTVLMTLAVIIFGTVIPFGCYLEGVRMLGPVSQHVCVCGAAGGGSHVRTAAGRDFCWHGYPGIHSDYRRGHILGSV